MTPYHLISNTLCHWGCCFHDHVSHTYSPTFPLMANEPQKYPPGQYECARENGDPELHIPAFHDSAQQVSSALFTRHMYDGPLRSPDM